MEKHNHTNHGNSFILGVIVGVALTLLLTTQKGRKILKIITEEGIEKLENWEDVIQAIKKSLPSQPSSNKVPEDAAIEQVVDTKTTEGLTEPVRPLPEEKTFHKIKATTRRFFKGAPKRV